MADVKKLAEELVNLTVKEVNELATILKEEYGIEPAAAAVAVAAPAAAAGEAAASKPPFSYSRFTQIGKIFLFSINNFNVIHNQLTSGSSCKFCTIFTGRAND